MHGSMPPLMRAAAPIAIALALMTAACQTTGTAGTDVSCRAFAPIIWSGEDTLGTQSQVRGHNAAWSSLCKRDGKNVR